MSPQVVQKQCDEYVPHSNLGVSKNRINDLLDVVFVQGTHCGYDFVVMPNLEENSVFNVDLAENERYSNLLYT